MRPDQQLVERTRRTADRARKGATTVFVAILSIALVGVAALAVDLARMNVAVNEVQTAADASALRAAAILQAAPGTDPDAATQAFAAANYRPFWQQNDDTPFALSAADITPGFWDDAARQFTAGGVSGGVGGANLVNSVEVRAAKTSRLLFGTLLSAVRPNPTRRSVAWIANVAGVRCNFEPFGLPISNLFNAIGSGTVNTRAPSQAEIARLDSMLQTLAGRVALTQILYPKDNGITPTTETSIYWPLADNMNQYADQIASGGGCGANADVSVGGSETSPFPGNGGGSNGKKAVDGALASPPANGTPICRRVANDATCYDPVTGEVGITLTVSYTGGGTNLASCPTTCVLPIRMIAGFRLICVFYGRITGNGPNGQVNNAERCPWLRDNFPSPVNKAYEVGTLVGYPVTSSPGLNDGITLGNTPSLAQRLILVR